MSYTYFIAYIYFVLFDIVFDIFKTNQEAKTSNVVIKEMFNEYKKVFKK